MEKTIEIQKKNRTIALVFATILLLGLGGIAIYLLVNFVFPDLLGFFRFKVTSIAIIAGAVIIGVYLIIRQGIRTKPGLIIDQHGITDNSTGINVGFIPWGDIITLKEAKNFLNYKLIVLIVRNPDEYINKSGWISQGGLQAQYKQFGSPIVISAGNLEYDTEELITMLNKRL